MVSMNRLSTEKRAQIVAALVEGCSVRSVSRMTGASKNTIQKLQLELGAACSAYMDAHLRNLPCKRVQVDEVWSFVYAKQKNVTVEIAASRVAGDVWTWVAMDAESKLVCSWMVGQRDPVTARDFMDDLAGRLASRVQLTSDGLKTYLTAVDKAFGDGIDYAMLVKIYGDPSEGQKRYSPADCLGCEKHTVKGNPDPKHISTTYIERQNLTMRMSMRRFTRLTNGFSKKIENHVAAIAIHYMHYNFVRIHQTLRVTPAMQAGVSDHVWSIEEMIGLLEA
jgi:IS1 family transposase